MVPEYSVGQIYIFEFYSASDHSGDRVELIVIDFYEVRTVVPFLKR